MAFAATDPTDSSLQVLTMALLTLLRIRHILRSMLRRSHPTGWMREGAVTRITTDLADAALEVFTMALGTLLTLHRIEGQ
jgi:hypothetical protein